MQMKTMEKKEKELYKTIFLSIGERVVTTDQTGWITALNWVAEEITGWSEEKVKGSRFAEVFKLVNETTDEEAKAMGDTANRKVSESLEQVIKEAEEWMYRRKLIEEKGYRKALINTLLVTLYVKSTETMEHSQRMKNDCLMIGKRMNLSAKELDELALLTVLHDIGKVGIRGSILHKPGPLTAEEWVEMKKHPEIGYRIAQNTPELAAIAEYILYHHERWDGKGYPRGLKGEEIPLFCRILAVADAYDAMTNDRTYRKALSKEEAIAEIRRNAGTQFDPQVVEIFLRIMVQEHNMKKRQSREK